jgi:acylphosphatase
MVDERPTRLTVSVAGQVQGVGFRWAVQARARELGLTGYAENTADGGVSVVAEGSRAGCDQLLGWLRGGQTPGRVNSVSERWSTARGDAEDFLTR